MKIKNIAAICKKNKYAAEPEQYSLNVDPATGEIVEDESEVADNA